jgi:hypothetical protein
LGTVQLRGGGRPQDVFGNGWNVNQRHLAHELYLTDLVTCFEQEATIVRDPSRVNQQICPDAEMTFQKTKRLFYVEFDTGTEELATIDRKWIGPYRTVRNFVLFVTLSPVRLQNVIERADAVKDIALFSTLDAVMADPWGPVFHDGYGNTVGLSSQRAVVDRGRG